MIKCSNKVNPYLYATIIAVVAVLADIVVKYAFNVGLSFVGIIAMGITFWIIFFYVYSRAYEKMKKR